MALTPLCWPRTPRSSVSEEGTWWWDRRLVSPVRLTRCLLCSSLGNSTDSLSQIARRTAGRSPFRLIRKIRAADTPARPETPSLETRQPRAQSLPSWVSYGERWPLSDWLWWQLVLDSVLISVFTTGEGQKVSWEIDLLRMRSKSFSPTHPFIFTCFLTPLFLCNYFIIPFLESSPPLVSFFFFASSCLSEPPDSLSLLILPPVTPFLLFQTYASAEGKWRGLWLALSWAS